MALNKIFSNRIFFKSPDRKSGLFILVAFVCLGCSFLLLQPWRPRPPIPYLIPPQTQHFSFGMKEQMADTLWVRALQDFGYCEQPLAKQVCRANSWVFRMLDLITDLAPKFRMPYATGGLTLSIVVNDQSGASVIFDKGVAAFPSDWPILSRAAYHALYEEKNKTKAAGLMERAAKAGAPPWYYLLAARLAKDEGDVNFGVSLLEELQKDPQADPQLLEALRKRVQEAQGTSN